MDFFQNEKPTMMKPPPVKPTHRVRVENDMIRRREKQFRHEQMWSDRQKYYEQWDKKNTKFDEWTSPRYHETQNKLITDIRTKQEKEENLEKRREKLRKLSMDEEKLYEIEMMIHKTKNSQYARPKTEDVPTEVLKELNLGLKLEEDERARHEAELKLYHQWRDSNPILKHYERMQRGRDLKLSWLDQQIDKRMQKEKEEEECRKILKERDQQLRESKIKEEEYKKHLEAKRQELKDGLDQQIRELAEKSKMAEELKKFEQEETKKRNELEDIENRRLVHEKRRLENECALYNIKQYKMKLKKKAQDIQESLENQKIICEKLKQFELAERIKNDLKRREIEQTLNEFLKLNREQKELERCRQRQLDFLFDSEAKMLYEQQEEIWRQEEMARNKLMEDVIRTIEKQILENLERNRQQQCELVKEKEEILKKAEEYKRELEQIKQEDLKKKQDYSRMIDDDIKIKSAKKRIESNLELKRIQEDLERTRKEEERLKREIMNIQRRQGPIRPPRNRIYF